MKKLIYTLILGLTFVACDKDNVESPMEMAQIAKEVKAIENDTKFADAFEFINNIVNSKKDLLVPSKANEAARPGDAGQNWLQVIFFEVDGTHVAFLRSDAQGEACPNGAENVLDVVYTLTDTQLIIEMDGEEVAHNVPVDTYAATFSSDGPDSVVVVNADRTAAAAGEHNVIVTVN